MSGRNNSDIITLLMALNAQVNIVTGKASLDRKNLCVVENWIPSFRHLSCFVFHKFWNRDSLIIYMYLI